MSKAFSASSRLLLGCTAWFPGFARFPASMAPTLLRVLIHSSRFDLYLFGGRGQQAHQVASCPHDVLGITGECLPGSSVGRRDIASPCIVGKADFTKLCRGLRSVVHGPGASDRAFLTE